jgi:DNA-binding transcriptional regulator YhcF (GntR family)
VLSYVLNSIAFETHSKDGDLESIAAHLGVDPNRLRPTLKKMEEQSVVTVEGSGEFVYPTTKTLRKQMPQMSVEDADKLLRKLHRR